MHKQDLELLLIAMTLLFVASLFYAARLQLALWRAQQALNQVVVVETRPGDKYRREPNGLALLWWVGFAVVAVGWYSWLG